MESKNYDYKSLLNKYVDALETGYINLTDIKVFDIFFAARENPEYDIFVDN